MKALSQYINEYLIKKKVDKVRGGYKYHPQTKEELKNYIEELLDKGETDLNCIDVSNITDMSRLFYDINNARDIDFNVSDWDVSNVELADSMFSDCHNFKGEGLENWDVSNVKDMAYMFKYCINFDCDLSNWNVSNVKAMDEMFYNCTKFKGNGLDKWNVKNVKGMYLMFTYCKSLKNKPSWYKE